MEMIQARSVRRIALWAASAALTATACFGLPQTTSSGPAAVSSSTLARLEQPLPARATPEDVLAELVKRAGAIFSGQVYAIRKPASPGGGTGAAGAMLASANPNAVEVEFRVDFGIRGTSVGMPYILMVPVALWNGAGPGRPEPFHLHDRAVIFLYAPDAAGFSGPVGGAAGVLPVDADFNVDLSRLHARVKPQPDAEAEAAKLLDQQPNLPPHVTDVTSVGGATELMTATSHGRMAALHGASIPFLALLRDIYVLEAAEQGGAAPQAAAPASR